jgi:hypothetical protein
VRKLSKLGISVLDTDFIIRSAVSPFPYEPTLLEKILTLGEKFYIHHQVREEVEWPQEAADLLDRLIKEGDIKQKCKSGGHSTNLWEIKTALLAAIFCLSNMERVTIFMSDDRRARNFIVSRYSEKYHEIKAVSVIGAYYILMKNGMPYEEARRYVDALETKEFKLFDKREKMTGLEIVDGIYANKLILLANGMLKLRA